MPLSEQDMLLLDCFMYSDVAPKSEKGMTVEDIISQFIDSTTDEVSLDIIKQSNINFSGDMNAEAFQDVLTKMKRSPAIMNLKLMKTSCEYTGSIRAACFVDVETGKATVAFRGTGGSYQQWYNNFEGYGEVSQQSQKDAAEFIHSLPYDNIDVTGHSNGGNQAMYVAVVCSDKVIRCVSYEGQGFSQEYTAQYADEIALNQDSIKNICGEKDFVSPLLTDISGERLYVPSDSELLGEVFDHGAYGILTANWNNLEKNNGNFDKSFCVTQAWYCTAIQQLSVLLVENSDTPLVGSVLELIFDIVGVFVGMIISDSWTKPEILLKACNDLINAVADLDLSVPESCIAAIKYICERAINWIQNSFDSAGRFDKANQKIELDTYKLASYAQRLCAVQVRIVRLDERLDSLYGRVGLLGLWNLIQADILTTYSVRLKKCVDYIYDTANDFDSVENELLQLV